MVAPGDQPASTRRVQATDAVNLPGEQLRFDPGARALQQAPFTPGADQRRVSYKPAELLRVVGPRLWFDAPSPS